MAKIRYRFKKPLLRGLFATYDMLGGLICYSRGSKKQPQRICLVILNQIGDLVLSLPTIEAILTMFPEAKVSVIAGKGPASLLESIGLPVTIHTFNASWHRVTRQFHGQEKSGIAGFQALLKEIRPDTCVIFEPDPFVNLLAATSRIPNRFGFVEAGGGFCLTHPLHMAQTGKQFQRIYALAEKIGTWFERPIPALSPPQLTATAPLELTVKHAVVLHPFSSAETKDWSTDNWRQLIGELKAKNLQPLIIGGSGNVLEGAECENLAGQLSLAETAALLAQAKVFIGIDSGPAHIAAAVGCPVISLFSSVNSPEQWAPTGQNVTVLYKEVRDRARYPREQRRLPTGTVGNPYLDQVTVEEVMHALSAIL